jgi:topoisomerase-4 subunit A
MLIDVKGWRAIGNKLSQQKIQKVKLLAHKAENDLEKKIEGGKANAAFEVGSTISLDVKKADPDKKDQLGLF